MQIAQNGERHENLKKIGAARRNCLLRGSTVIPGAGDERICGGLPRVRSVDRQTALEPVKLPHYFLEGHEDA